MSNPAHIIVLFKTPTSASRIEQLEVAISNRLGYAKPVDKNYGRLVEVDNADLEEAQVSDDGALKWDLDARLSPMIGSPLLQGRLFCISYRERHCGPTFSEGPVVDYVVTLLTILSQPDIQGVWFVDSYFFEGGTAQKQTYQSVHEMLDAYVRFGATFGGKLVRYVVADGHSIME